MHTYRPRGAQLRIRDVIAKMQNRVEPPKKVVYAKAEIEAAKKVLLTILANAEANTVSYTNPVISEDSDE